MSDVHVRQTIQVYDKAAANFAKQAPLYVPNIERDKFIKLISPKSTILDLGCGTGRDVRFFTDLGCHVTGLDLSEKMLEIARELTPQAIYKMQDIRKLLFAENSFDAIWAYASLVHLKKAELPGVLTSLFKILKPNGIVFLHEKLGTGEGYKIEPSVPDQARYYSYYEKDEFENLVKTAGFNIMEIYTYNDATCFKTDRKTDWISCFVKKI
jgi:ubiquinone/menaquinone biosynthesis C-methylase UbiE